ncbi:MAG: tetratricopeptide repeat protein [Nitrospirota bacterium]
MKALRPSRDTATLAGAFIGMALVALAAHGGALGGGFHYDDHFGVAGNPAVRNWQPARAFLTVDAVVNERQAAGYRPLTVMSLAANYRVSGLKASAYLATNLALHALAAGLVFWVAWVALGDPRWAAVAGVVFALHPINAEAVNYVTARSSLLATVFALTATGAFFRYVQRGGPGTLLAGLVAFGCALLSKESSVVLAAPLLAARWLVPACRTHGRRALRTALGYTALAALFVALFLTVTAGGVISRLPAPRPAWTLAEMIGRSLALWVWPWPLGLDHRLTFILSFDPWLAGWLVVGAVALAALVVFWIRRLPVAAWGVLWALAGLAPLAPLPWLTSAGLLQEHRMAFSAAGLSVATAALAGAAWAAVSPARSRRAAAWGFACAGLALAIAAAVVDRSRSAVWRDDRLLWGEVVRHWPENIPARINLGAAYMLAGDHDRAEAEYLGIAARSPGYPRVYYNLGLLALRRGRTEDATAAFERVIALNPMEEGAHAHLGILALRGGDTAAAEAAFRRALAIDPAQRDALNNLAAIYLERQAFTEALELVTAALERDPEFLEAAYNRGLALAALGRRAEAAAVLRDVLGRLPPAAAFDRYRAGIAYVLEGDGP